MDKRLLVKREGEFSYPICFTRDFSKLSEVLKEEGFSGRRCLVITDSVVEGLYLKQAMAAIEEAGCPCESVTFPAGEEHKNLPAIQDFYRVLLEGGYDRSCFLAALGGGVCGDMTGFTAATYLRGVDFIQLPTTLLAQVDSSVGGKTGVDYLSYKNMVGAFHQPRLVYMAMDTLKTLPREQFSSGMGEVLKTGLICDSALFFDTLKQKEGLLACSYEELTDVIYRCIQIKAMIVERDPKEKGERALLNLGHTIGHAIEKCKNFALLHGMCVGLGLVAAFAIAKNRNLVTEEEMDTLLLALTSFGLPTKVEGIRCVEVLAATKKDKKMEQGKVKFIMPRGIGDSYIDKTVTEEEMLMGIRAVVQEG